MRPLQASAVFVSLLVACAYGCGSSSGTAPQDSKGPNGGSSSGGGDTEGSDAASEDAQNPSGSSSGAGGTKDAGNSAADATSSGSSSGSSGSSGSSSSGSGSSGAGADAGVKDSGTKRDAQSDASATRDGGSNGGGDASATSEDAGSSCAPPPASPLVGWAAVSGDGVTTTTGGGDAAPTVVTTLDELTAAAKGTTAAVIVVQGSIAGSVTIGSNKTIVGVCGAQITGHLQIGGSTNVIVRNLKVVGFNCTDAAAVSAMQCSSGADAITVNKAAEHIWFDHDDISDGSDGNLDITQVSDWVTVSWTKFHYSTARADLVGGSDSTGANGHRFSDLIGASDSDTTDQGHLRVTFHHDWWADNVVERMPRTRFGQIHVYNSLFTSTGNAYCIGVGVGANVRDENNAFIGVRTPVDTTSFTDSTSVVGSIGNLYTMTSGDPVVDLGTVFVPPYSYALDDATAVQAEVQAGAGPQ